jgi:carboxylesterase type B
VLPSSAGLFASASLQSPGSHVGWSTGTGTRHPNDWIAAEDSLRSSAALARKLGCRGPADLGCLRAATAEEVVKAARATKMRFAPALPDGEFPLRLIRKGRWKRVPVAVGSCSCEACKKKSIESLLAGQDISEDEFRADLLKEGFNEKRGSPVGPEKIEQWYAGRLRKENRLQVKYRVSSDASHACSAKLHADALQHGADSNQSGVWRYYFDLGSKGGTHVNRHGCGDWWIMGTNPDASGVAAPDRGEPEALSRQDTISHWWYSLAAFGDPNVGSTSSLHWSEYSVESPQTLIVDEAPWVGVTEETQAKECSHWQEYLGF